MRMYIAIFFLLLMYSCSDQPEHHATGEQMNAIALRYVRLGLAIGSYDPDFVDAYYGPDSLKPIKGPESTFPKEHFLKSADSLLNALSAFREDAADTTLSKRADWLSGQLLAFKRRIHIFSGEDTTFDQEAKALFGVVPPTFSEAHFLSLVKEMDKLLPGSGPVANRFQELAQRFVIPGEKLDMVYKASIAESRRRTTQHIALPPGQNFQLEFVTGKPWSGYNWYQGNYKSLIQINTDVTALIEKAVDVASHEGYPGHHVYNSLLEENLYRKNGWAEISLYPLFSPQSLIAEGSANYGIEVAFPGKDKIQFVENVLLPLAGLDTTGITIYFKALEIKEALQYVRTEVARGILSGTMPDAEATRWLMEYGLFNEKDAEKSLAFTRKYRSYVINYTYGKDMVKKFIEAQTGTPGSVEKRWDAFKWLLSNEVSPSTLLQHQN